MKKNTNLFCLAFAGGNKYSYRQFSDKASSNLNIITLEYPGRGSRLKEQLVSDIHDLTDDLYRQISKMANQEKYAIYGHSMGGLAAYLLTLKLIENNHRLPEHLFITGTTGPSSGSRSKKKRHLLAKNDFIQEIRELGGMPDEILQNEELLNYLEPILRSDFMASENYVYNYHEPLDLPFTVITGTEEDLEAEEILLWQKESCHTIDFRQMTGNHFFILQHTDQILEIIAEKLSHQIMPVNYGQ